MIPEDLVFRILVLLPVASLLRFKSVCKSWLSHIATSAFISQHLSTLDDDKLIFLDSPNIMRPYFYLNFNFIFVNNLQLSKHIEFSPTNDDSPQCFMMNSMAQFFNENLIASFNGVICLTLKRKVEHKDGKPTFDVVSLWNPATMQFTILPPPQSDFKEDIQVGIEYGFGFDVKANDYKVVRVVVEDLVYDSDTLKSQVEVYSLKMDSWRVIDVGVPLKVVLTSNPKKPFGNEIYCWLGYEWMSRRRLIISFDFSKEMFGIIPMPDVYINDSQSNLDLAFLRDKIACFAFNSEDPLHRNVWVMNEFGVKESWTKLYTITVGHQFDQTIGVSMDGKIILFKRRPDELCLCVCDPLTQEVNELPSQGVHPEAAVYKESLISVKSANGVTRRVVYEESSKKNLNLLDLRDARQRKAYFEEIEESETEKEGDERIIEYNETSGSDDDDGMDGGDGSFDTNFQLPRFDVSMFH